LPRATGGEHEGDFRSAEGTTPHKQLEQNLEPAGSELLQVDGIRSDEEEPAHRIGDAAKAPREQHPRRRREAVEISRRTNPSPSARPCWQYRLATTRSAPSRFALASSLGMASGGC
jgi:hypothetical protein